MGRPRFDPIDAVSVLTALASGNNTPLQAWDELPIIAAAEGRRQASKDLHSLRRWHMARCRDALNAGAQGFSMWTAADNVGHAKGGLGLSMTSRYAGGRVP
jgi:hypothetical protein